MLLGTSKCHLAPCNHVANCFLVSLSLSLYSFYLGEITLALEHLHSQGIIYRYDQELVVYYYRWSNMVSLLCCL